MVKEMSNRQNQHFRISKVELSIVVALAGLYVHSLLTHNVPLIVCMSFILGGWLVFRPVEEAIRGIEGICAAYGISTYMGGVLISLASNTPEAAILGFTLWRGYVSGNIEFMEVAVLTVLSTIGFNILLLGLVIVVAAGKKNFIEVPPEALEKELELVRFTVAALMAIFALGVIDVIFSSGQRTFYIPKEAAVLMVAAYITYLIFAGRGVPPTEEVAKEEVDIRKSVISLIVGFTGLFIGAHILVHGVEMILTKEAVAGFGDPIIMSGLILGLMSAVPEHAVALVGAMKGQIDFPLGNLLGSLSQVVLLILGGVAIVVPIILDKYVLFQILITAICIWFLKRSILDDEKLDSFEGVMIMLIQVFVFTLLVRGLI